MKKLWSQVRQNNWVLIGAIAVVFATAGIGATYAYNQHDTNLDNLLRAFSVSGEIIENGKSVGDGVEFDLNPGRESQKRVRFKNTGEAAVFVRVSFGVNWMSRDEWLVNHSQYVKLNWTDAWDEEWEPGDDGWYYYKKILPSNTLTKEILTSVEFGDYDKVPMKYLNADYRLFFVMEVVQYSDEDEVNNNALKDVFNRSATVKDGNIVWN